MKKENIALIIILAIQLLVYIFLGVQKSYIHMDEAYSIGLTNYDKVEITDNEDFYGNWHNSAYYEDYLSISQEEVKNVKPVYENQKNDVHPPFYYLLLRIAYSFHLNEFSKWPGIILNIIFFICSNILIYKILTKIIKNKKIALLMCLVSGLVISSLESVTYIRMYALNSFILLAIAYLHILNYKKEELDIKNLILIGTATLIASLTHYYNIIYIGIIYLIYAIIYLKNKQYKNLRKYTLAMVIAAICSLAIFPYSIKHIFMGYRGQGVLETFKEPSKMISNLANYITILNEKVFNGTLWLIAIFLVGVCIFKLVKNKQITIKVQNEKLSLIIIPAIIYFLFVAVSSPYTEIRYIIPVCNFIFIFVIYELYEVINKVLKEERNSDILISIILILILVMPLKTNAKVDNLYLQRKEIVSQVTEKYGKIPTIYLFNSSQNRFLDDIYMFTKINESYILEVKDASTEKVQEILQNKDISNGIVVWVNEGFEKKQYLEMIKNSNNFKNCEHIQRMNACDIYYIY